MIYEQRTAASSIYVLLLTFIRFHSTNFLHPQTTNKEFNWKMNHNQCRHQSWTLKHIIYLSYPVVVSPSLTVPPHALEISIAFQMISFESHELSPWIEFSTRRKTTHLPFNDTTSVSVISASVLGLWLLRARFLVFIRVFLWLYRHFPGSLLDFSLAPSPSKESGWKTSLKSEIRRNCVTLKCNLL